MRRILKRAGERGLLASGAIGALRRSRGPTAAVLAYHNVVPDGEPCVGDGSLHIAQRLFGAHLDRLMETHEVVPLAGLRDSVGGEGARPRAVITFDDAYVGTLTAGFEELRRRDLPATVFVPPGLLGAEGFWWDLLSVGGTLAPSVRDHALGELQGRQDQVLDRAVRDGARLAHLPDHARPASVDRLEELARQPGITLGSHTWSHPNLAALSPEDRVEELDRSRAWITSHARAPVDWIAFPYGLHDDAVVRDAAARFSGALLVYGGLALLKGAWTSAPHRTPRLNVAAGLSADGLSIRLAGMGV